MVDEPIIIRLRRTTSTNDVAADLARRGAEDGTVVIADEQTAGRGRRGRSWQSPPRRSLLCSLILRPPLAAQQAGRLTMLAAVAVARAIRHMGLPAELKWPNDILIGGRKVGGILAETEIIGDRLLHAIVGIGINVSLTAADLARISAQATSLTIEAGRRVSRWRLLRLFLAEFQARYRVIGSDHGQSVFAEWASLLHTLGREVTVVLDGGAVTGVAEAVDADGALLLHRADGHRLRVTVGDVS